MAEAGADMFKFNIYVCCSGWKQCQKLRPTCLCSMFVCVAVGGSNVRRWGRHVYVQYLCVLQWVEAMSEAEADMFMFHVCVCCSGWKQCQMLGPTCSHSMSVQLCVAVGHNLVKGSLPPPFKLLMHNCLDGKGDFELQLSCCQV